jgi:hypothetical protein
MDSLDRIVASNGGDNTPMLDTHNLTGRALPKGVEPGITVREPECKPDSYIYGSWVHDTRFCPKGDDCDMRVGLISDI